MTSTPSRKSIHQGSLLVPFPQEKSNCHDKRYNKTSAKLPTTTPNTKRHNCEKSSKEMLCGSEMLHKKQKTKLKKERFGSDTFLLIL